MRYSQFFVIVLLIPLIVACGEEPQERELIRAVKVIKVQDVEAFRERQYPGRAEATQEVNIAFEVPGQLVERPANVGDEVTQGALLARLDPRDYQAALDRALAERERARAYLGRIQVAVKSGAVSRQDLTDAQAQFNVAQATVEIRQKALEDTVIVAEFDGTVAATYVENFQNVKAKQSILRLLDTSQIEFWVNIPEALISNIPFVRNIEVEYDAFPGKPVPATIYEVSNEASETTRTYPVNLIMEQPDNFTILPGMAGKATGRVDLPNEDELQGFEVPFNALYNPGNEAGGKTFVWVLDEGPMTVSLREIQKVDLTARGAVITGVEPGETIVVAGVSYLREGQKVRIAAPSATR